MDLDALVEEALREVAAASDDNALVQARARLLGRNGSLTAELRGLGQLEPEARATRGKALNLAKQKIEAAFAERQDALAAGTRAAQLSGEGLDVTLPPRGTPAGHLHPLTLVEREMVELFRGFGFEWVDGPEVETEHYNFEALNIPADHPARDMQDTFYLADGIVLRTHTSPVQIRTLEGREPPLRIITTGRVYRHELSNHRSPCTQSSVHSVCNTRSFVVRSKIVCRPWDLCCSCSPLRWKICRCRLGFRSSEDLSWLRSHSGPQNH